MTELIKLFSDFGPLVIIAAIFVIDSRARERRMGVRLDKVEDWIKKELIQVIRDNTQALTTFSRTIDRGLHMIGHVGTGEQLKYHSTAERNQNVSP